MKAPALPLAGLGLILALALLPAPGRSGARQDTPGPLSSFHAVKPGDANCAACHVGPGKVSAAKCLACHTEIASRIAARRGYHRDKADDCAVCHGEHQGRPAELVPLDPADFDHSETGADLQGAHTRIDLRSCGTCHTLAHSYPRAQGRSYLLKVPGCLGCHRSPHPGRQDRCLDCHAQNDWSVGRGPAED